MHVCLGPRIRRHSLRILRHLSRHSCGVTCQDGTQLTRNRFGVRRNGTLNRLRRPFMPEINEFGLVDRPRRMEEVRMVSFDRVLSLMFSRKRRVIRYPMVKLGLYVIDNLRPRVTILRRKGDANQDHVRHRSWHASGRVEVEEEGLAPRNVVQAVFYNRTSGVSALITHASAVGRFRFL